MPPRGPICRGPICRGPICRQGAQSAGARFAGAQFATNKFSGAQFAAPKIFRGPICRGPNLPGPNLPGPNLPGPNLPGPNLPQKSLGAQFARGPICLEPSKTVRTAWNEGGTSCGRSKPMFLDQFGVAGCPQIRPSCAHNGPNWPKMAQNGNFKFRWSKTVGTS